MKLLTHNLLRSPVKGAKMDSALKLEATQIETNEVDFNQEFVINIVPKLEWSVLYTAVDSVCFLSSISFFNFFFYFSISL